MPPCQDGLLCISIPIIITIAIIAIRTTIILSISIATVAIRIYNKYDHCYYSIPHQDSIYLNVNASYACSFGGGYIADWGLEALWPIMDEAPLSTSKFATWRSLQLEPQEKK